MEELLFFELITMRNGWFHNYSEGKNKLHLKIPLFEVRVRRSDNGGVKNYTHLPLRQHGATHRTRGFRDLPTNFSPSLKKAASEQTH